MPFYQIIPVMEIPRRGAIDCAPPCLPSTTGRNQLPSTTGRNQLRPYGESFRHYFSKVHHRASTEIRILVPTQ